MPTPSTPVPTPADHRAATRFDTAVSLNIAGRKAEAHNISATGLYFETDVEMPLGALVHLNVQFTHGGRKHWVACEGKVVRVTHEDGHHGIGAQLVTPFFAPEEEQIVAQPARR